MDEVGLRPTLAPDGHGRPTRARPVVPTQPRHIVDAPSVSPRDGGSGTDLEDALAEKWADLIERIRRGAAQIHEQQANLRQREDELQAFAIQAQEELRAAHERALRAEVRTREIEAECKRETVEWRKRTQIAEAKVRAMEDMMSEARDALLQDFV